jgi:RND family efflux transporter MFP subunit
MAASCKQHTGVLRLRVGFPPLLAPMFCVLTALKGAGDEPPQIRGLTEPYRSIDVAATESGVIAALHVREGQTVAKGEVLAALDCRLLTAMLSIAKQGMQATGRLDAARAEVQLKEDRAKSFAAVFASGHARPEELQRAETDLAIARAYLRAAEEDLVVKRLEYQKIKTQIEGRKVFAPIHGIVAQIHKDEGEFVAPNDPCVLTMVQLDPLLAVFALTTQQASQLHTGQEIRILIGDAARPASATVDFIAPVADAESGTLLVKLRVDNPAGEHCSGERCTLDLSSVDKPREQTADVALGGRAVSRERPP